MEQGLFKKLIVSHLPNKFLASYDTHQGSLTCSQEPATEPCLESDKSSP
jgi:hypothetical protein